LSVPTAVSLLDLADEDRRPSWESNSHSGHSEASDWLTVSVDLWWVDIPGQERAFFTSAKDAWHHAGKATHQQLAAAQVFRGTFRLTPASVEHTGDFTAMAESFRKARVLGREAAGDAPVNASR